MVLEPLDITGQKMNVLDLNHSLYTKMNSKWITDWGKQQHQIQDGGQQEADEGA